MTRVAVVGATGFVGRACRSALELAGAEIVPVKAPRLDSVARTPTAIAIDADRPDLISGLASALRGCDVVLNAAGAATATAQDTDQVFGANALLPTILQTASRSAGVQRFVHISSAAVQGRSEPLNECETVSPFSAYSRSKALGEVSLARGGDVTIFRPTSVHGPDRAITRRLARIARSMWCCVSGTGTAHTPQAHVENVGQAAAVLCTTDSQPPRIVIQPSEGWTTGSLMEVLGGHPPWHIPRSPARASVALAYHLGSRFSIETATARRLDLLLFGQAQSDSWLSSIGFTLRAGSDAWATMAKELALAAEWAADPQYRSKRRGIR